MFPYKTKTQTTANATLHTTLYRTQFFFSLAFLISINSNARQTYIIKKISGPIQLVNNNALIFHLQSSASNTTRDQTPKPKTEDLKKPPKLSIVKDSIFEQQPANQLHPSLDQTLSSCDHFRWFSLHFSILVSFRCFCSFIFLIFSGVKKKKIQEEHLTT